MSLQSPKTRKELRQYVKTRLGHPVVDINISDEQLDIAIADAFDFFSEYSSDAKEEQYIAVEVTQEMHNSKSLTTPENIQGVTGIFRGGSDIGEDLFSVSHALESDALNQSMSANGGTALTSIYLTQQYISQLDDLLNYEYRYRYNSYKNTLHIDTNWQVAFPVGSILVYEAVVILDPDEVPELYNHFVIKDLATANAKFQWGTNLSKFEGVQLPGGTMLNGSAILAQGQLEIDSVKQEFILKHQEPDGFYVG